MSILEGNFSDSKSIRAWVAAISVEAFQKAVYEVL
jgi:hypothetical protein